MRDVEPKKGRGGDLDLGSLPSAVLKDIDAFSEECLKKNLERRQKDSLGPRPEQQYFYDVSDYGAIRLSINALAFSEEFNDDTEAIMRWYLGHTARNPFASNVLRGYDRHFYGDHEMFASSSLFSIVYDMLIREAKEEYGGLAHNLFLYVFKTYRTDLYRQLKRCDRVTREFCYDVLAADGLALSELNEHQTCDLALLLVAAGFMQKDLGDPSLGEVYGYLSARVADLQEVLDDAMDHADALTDVIGEEMGLMDFEEEDSVAKREVLTFVEGCQELHGLPFNAYQMFARPYGLRARAVMRCLGDFPNEAELTERERSAFFAIDALVELLSRMRYDHADSIEPFFVGDDGDLDPVKFDPGKVMGAVPIPGVKSGAPKKEEVTVIKETATDGGKKRDEEDALSSLSARIHSLEAEAADLRQKAAGRARQEKEIDRLRNLIDVQAQELAALRSFAFHSTAADEGTPSEVSADRAREFLGGKKIVVVGGHPNWVSKMKKEFNGWKFIKPAPSGTIDPGFVTGADFVFFFTDTLSHATYGKYVTACREHGVRFGYLHGVNVAATIQQARLAICS